jgi:hypothetical protein
MVFVEDSVVDAGVKARHPTRSPKKAYSKPVLVVYGDIETITLSTATSTTGDNAAHKTHNAKTGG